MSSFRRQRRNANRHTPRGLAALEQSIQQDGWIGAITAAADGEIFDGSAREETAGQLDNAIIVESDGSRPVIVKRTDIPSADDARAVRLGIAANRIAQLNLDWDSSLLAALADETPGLLDGMWSDDDLSALLEAAGDQVLGDDVPSIRELWAGMPEFSHQDKTAFQSITVHFKDQDAVAAFAALVGQKITSRTRYLWYPEIEIETYADKRYAPES